MALGIVVFGAAFLAGLGLGTYTRRPLSTAFLVLGSFTALLVLTATGELLDAAAVLAVVGLLGLVAESMRETLARLVTCRQLMVPAPTTSTSDGRVARAAAGPVNAAAATTATRTATTIPASAVRRPCASDKLSRAPIPAAEPCSAGL